MPPRRWFQCASCRSSRSAVDENAHERQRSTTYANRSAIENSNNKKKQPNNKKQRNGDGAFEEDLAAVKWLRSRSLENASFDADDMDAIMLDRVENEPEIATTQQQLSPYREDEPYEELRIIGQDTTATTTIRRSITNSDKQKGAERPSVDSKQQQQQERMRRLAQQAEQSPVATKKQPQRQVSANNNKRREEKENHEPQHRLSHYRKALQRLEQRAKTSGITRSESRFLNDLLGQYQQDPKSSTEVEARIAFIESALDDDDDDFYDDQRAATVVTPSSIDLSMNDISFHSASPSGGGGIEMSVRDTKPKRKRQPKAVSVASPPPTAAAFAAFEPPKSQQQQSSRNRNQHRQPDNDDEDRLDDSPYPVLGLATTSRTGGRHRPLLTISLMEALRGFLPYSVSEQNFWLKFCTHRDGTSLTNLMHCIQHSQHTLMIIESKEGHIFGSFTSSRWRQQKNWFGSGQAFMFRKHGPAGGLEVYPYTGSDDLIQYCSSQMVAVGGGDWNTTTSSDGLSSPYGKDQVSGIALLIDGDLLGGASHSCATFCNPAFCAKNDFEIVQFQVWTLTPCMTESEAKKLEQHKAFVETHAVAR